MYRQEGYDIGDAWYYAEGDTVHLFCLLGSGGRSDIAHLVSRDLRNWENAGFALRRGAAGSWDDLRLATGSVIRHQGTYWMAYTGHHSGDDPMVQRVGMACSTDLYRWTKLPQNPVSEANAKYYELMATGKRPKVHWRDPFLLRADATARCFATRRRRAATGDRAAQRRPGDLARHRGGCQVARPAQLGGVAAAAA